MEENRQLRKQQKRRMGIFVVAVVMAALVGLAYAYTAGSDQSTVTVAVALEGNLSKEQLQALSQRLTSYAGGWRERTQVELYPFPTPQEDPDGALAGRQLTQLLEQLESGPADLYLLDGAVWELVGGQDLFQDLSELFPEDPALLDGYRYALGGKPFLQAEGLEALEGLTASLRSQESPAVNRTAATVASYQLQEALLEAIAAGTPMEPKPA